MHVRVRLFGRLHDLAGTAELERDVPAGATVGDVWQQLAREMPAMAPYSRSVSAAVNADFARMTATVSDGDEIAFLPPVSGGCVEDVGNLFPGRRVSGTFFPLDTEKKVPDTLPQEKDSRHHFGPAR